MDSGGFPGIGNRKVGGFPGIGKCSVGASRDPRRFTIPDEKRKPGRPRKWSSDAERMRAARAAKREERRVAEERRAARREQQEQRTREKHSTASTPDSVAVKPAPSVPDDVADEDISNQAEIDKLRAEVRRLEDEFDDVVYDRWIFETQLRMAFHRMRQHDPDGLAWLDKQLRRWEIGREGTLEQRRRARRSWETGRL